MFCPSCRDEFRAGFTHCAACDEDLVAELPSRTPQPLSRVIPVAGEVRLVDYCGFMSLDEARSAREQLRQARVRTEIVIRDPSDRSAGDHDEFWLRVDATAWDRASALLGLPEELESHADGEVYCDACDGRVTRGESFCPHCGARINES